MFFPRGQLRTATLVGLVLVFSAGFGGAQGFQMSSGRSAEVPSHGFDAIAVGPFLFSPAIQLGWESQDNIFRRSSNPTEDQIYVARLRLLFEIPIRESFIRISYNPQYRDYKNLASGGRWEHYLSASGDFKFSSGLTLSADYTFIDSDNLVGQIDPGGELVFNGQRFRRHNFGVNAGYWFSSTDGLLLDVTETKVGSRGESAPEASSWLNYSQTTSRAGWMHQLSPTLVMDVSLDYRKHRPDAEVDSIRAYSGVGLTVGLRGQINEVFSTSMRVGYAETDFSKAASEVPGFADFSGLVYRGDLTWALGSESKLRLDLLRGVYPSNYDLNSYYTATGGRLLYDIDRGRFFGQARLRIQTNSYGIPDSTTGVKRSDDLTVFSAGVGLRFIEKLSVRAGYSHENRDSIDPFDSVNNTWFLDLILGY